MLTIDHSARLDEKFDNYIRIPYADFDMDPEVYIRFGAVRVTVDAPSRTFQAISTLVILYPEQD